MQILQTKPNYIPAQAFMIFFRGPMVYISPTRIPARCPAKEVLKKKKDNNNLVSDGKKDYFFFR